MTIELLSKQELQLFNKQGFKYPLAITEKDYFLAIVLKILYDSPLKDILVFKGGTALHHTYLPQLRFSQDLDFTAYEKVTIDDLQSAIGEYEFLEIKKHYTSPLTVKIERLGYQGVLDMPSFLRVEIDFTQNVALPPKKIKYQNAYNVDVVPAVMDIKEICAEKIRAMNERYRYRDFYDFGMILKYMDIDLVEVVQILNKKEQRKPLTLKNILDNWELASQAKTQDVEQIFLSEEISVREIYDSLSDITIS
ncbi:MAG: nucleotidyl transferase AbiEii/AbiGii toxin family protein [Deferribacteres bacterium]|nr:nucleotidyl transferase AbiEii/AbiGii toxin family protein [candidate division KSB1 bacterium]MCB9503226.1 nucleotidyl transferase AbiEii/AbiGii toxin family protein [Deferribacteres bacterium]